MSYQKLPLKNRSGTQNLYLTQNDSVGEIFARSISPLVNVICKTYTRLTQPHVNINPQDTAQENDSLVQTDEQALQLQSDVRRPGILRTLMKNPQAAIAGLFLLFLTIIAMLAKWLFPGDPLDMVAAPLLWPGEDMMFPLGSDSLGRNVLAELVHGVQVSLVVGSVSALMSLTIGLFVGCLSGFFGGWVNSLLMRITEFFQTIPSFLLVIVLVVIGGPQVKVIVLAIGIASWPVIARLTRAEFRALREAEFVLAARSQGFSNTRIIFREMLPNALPAVIVTTSVLVATAILMEAALAFLGLGDPNVVSWGSMIGEGREQLRTSWFLTAIPGGAIVLTVLSLNLLGDALNDALNPRLRSAA